MIVESLVLFLTLNYICIWCVYIVKKQSFCNRLKRADPQFQLTNCNCFANTCLPGTLAGILPTFIDTAILSEWPEHPTPKGNVKEKPYLIFVHSINSSASVKKLTEGNFFLTINTKRTPDSVLLYTVCYFTHNMSFYTQCVILLTVCNFTHIV